MRARKQPKGLKKPEPSGSGGDQPHPGWATSRLELVKAGARVYTERRMPGSRTCLTLCIGAGTLLIGAATARAENTPKAPGDVTAACIEQHRASQVLRNESRLIEARVQLLACSQDRCPGLLRRDCDALLRKTDQEMPSIVVAATGKDGHAARDVTVTIDGQVATHALEGQALNVDPGTHKFEFSLPDGTTRSEEVIIHTGQKLRQIPVSFQEKPLAPKEGFHVPTLAWVLGGVGVAAFGAAGALYFPAKSDADCILGDNDTGEELSTDALQKQFCGTTWSSVQSRYTWTNVSWISGTVLLAGAVTATIWVNVDGDDDGGESAAQTQTQTQVGFDGSQVFVRGTF